VRSAEDAFASATRHPRTIGNSLTHPNARLVRALRSELPREIFTPHAARRESGDPTPAPAEAR
jgi:hypothetical protein